jgi:hypothetical protein
LQTVSISFRTADIKSREQCSEPSNQEITFPTALDIPHISSTAALMTTPAMFGKASVAPNQSSTGVQYLPIAGSSTKMNRYDELLRL